MNYQAYQAWVDMTAPARLCMHATVNMLAHSPWMRYPGAAHAMSACELLLGAQITHARPDFRIRSIRMADNGAPREVAVQEEAAHVMPFCTLVHFRKQCIVAQPRVMIVAPLSGHFASGLRETVLEMLPDHDVYITDWHNARDVPAELGRFGLEDYIRYLMSFLAVLGPGTHVLAISQACNAALAAAALMAEDDAPARPRSLTLLGGPIDPRVNPTGMNQFAATTPLSWFEKNSICHVPMRYAGATRRVYPGFLQLAALMQIKSRRQIASLATMVDGLFEGDPRKTGKANPFYEENLAVMDLTADFYIETLRDIFQECALPRREQRWAGRLVNPAAIRDTALLTVEAGNDEICGPGQTVAAHDLCESLRPDMKKHRRQDGVNHDDLFRGACWRERIYPLVRHTIAAMH